MVEYTATRTRSVYQDLEKLSGEVLSLTVPLGAISVPRYSGYLQVRWRRSWTIVSSFSYRFKLPLLRPPERQAQLQAGGLQGQTGLRAVRSNLPHLNVCKIELDQLWLLLTKEYSQVHFNDSSIGMIHQDYLVSQSNISIMYQVSLSSLSPDLLQFYFRQMTLPGWLVMISAVLRNLTSYQIIFIKF